EESPGRAGAAARNGVCLPVPYVGGSRGRPLPSLARTAPAERRTPMNEATVFLIIVVVVVVFFVFLFLLGLIGIIALIFFLSKANRSLRLHEVDSIVRDWAEQHGYELLGLSEEGIQKSPFADRFGFGFDKKPAIVRVIEARDPKGRVRRGWIYLRARFAGRGGYRGFLRDTPGVAWAH